MNCKICGQEVSRWFMVGHNKEKHPGFYRLFVRLQLLRGVIAGIIASIFVFQVTRDLSVGFSGSILQVYIPELVLGLSLPSLIIEIYLAKAAGRMKNSA